VCQRNFCKHATIYKVVKAHTAAVVKPMFLKSTCVRLTAVQRLPAVYKDSAVVTALQSSRLPALMLVSDHAHCTRQMSTRQMCALVQEAALVVALYLCLSLSHDLCLHSCPFTKLGKLVECVSDFQSVKDTLGLDTQQYHCCCIGACEQKLIPQLQDLVLDDNCLKIKGVHTMTG